MTASRARARRRSLLQAPGRRRRAAPTSVPARAAADVDERAGHGAGAQDLGRRIATVGGADVLLVSLGSTAGLRASDAELAAPSTRAGRPSAVAAAAAARDVRTLALTDLPGRAAARAAARARDRRAGRARSSTRRSTAALLWPRAGRDPLRRARRAPTAPAATASGSARSSAAGCARAAAGAVERRLAGERRARTRPPSSCRSRRAAPRRAAGRRARHRRAHLRRRTRTRRASTACSRRGRGARRDGEELVVAGSEPSRHDAPGVRVAGALAPDDYRALAAPRARLRHRATRARTTASRSSRRSPTAASLVTTAAPGPYAALPLARALDPRLVPDDTAGSRRRCGPRSTIRPPTTPSARSPRWRRPPRRGRPDRGGGAAPALLAAGRR